MSQDRAESGSLGGVPGLLMALAFLSGCCALAYEILYMRALTTVLGDMLYVHAALLSTFLVGIGIGAKLASHGFRWLWLYEILTGVYALLLPVASRWFTGQPGLSAVTSSPTLTIVTTVVVLSAPSLLIGFSIPLFSAYIKARESGRLAFQGVYKAYNLGAVLSILAVELFLVRHLGIALSLALIGAINIVNGVVLVAARAAPPTLPPIRPRVFPRRVVVALALASIASAAFQMFFLKLTYVVFSPHRENFAVGLSISLLGVFLGAWLVGKVKTRFETFLAMIPVFIGATYITFLPWVRLYMGTAGWARSSELLVLLHKFGIGCLFALGPMILFGATLPALMRSENEVAEESGHLLFVSSLANAAGYLGYVLLGHPRLPTDILLLVIGGAALVASLIVTGLKGSRSQWALVAASIVLGAVLVSTWEERNFYLAQWLQDLRPGDEVIVFKSGAESATLLRSSDYEWISYNGHPSIFAQRKGVIEPAELLSGVIPGLGAPRLERALIVGFGTGITSGALSRIFEQTDVVEINNAFYRMMPELSHVNFDVEHNPGAELHLSDGRAFLVGKDQAYDAIVNSVPAPTYFSASKIYTVEFYERVAAALKPDGVFCTWLAVPNMSEEGVYTILSALRKSFEYCDLRLIGPWYYEATCSNEPVRVRSFSEAVDDPELIREIEKGLPGFDLDEFFEDVRLTDNVFERFEPEVERENTDDHPVLEFMVVRSYKLGVIGGDPFLDHPERFGIDAAREHEAADADRFARRAGAFHLLNPWLFEKNFQPLITDRLDRQVAWRLWLETHASP